ASDEHPHARRDRAAAPAEDGRRGRGARDAIIADLSRFPRDMEIIVEASPQDDASWEQVFAEMKANGFAAYEIANSYEIDWYLGWRRPTPLRKIDTMMRGQQDLLFSRRQRAT